MVDLTDLQKMLLEKAGDQERELLRELFQSKQLVNQKIELEQRRTDQLLSELRRENKRNG